MPHVHVHICGHHGGQDGQVHRPPGRAELRADAVQVAAMRPARHVPQLHDPVSGVQTRPGFQVSRRQIFTIHAYYRCTYNGIIDVSLS